MFGLRYLTILSVMFACPAAGIAQSASTKVRVAAISFEPVKFDLPGNTKKLEASFRTAAAGGAKIAVAPEGILEGYVVNEIIAGDSSAEHMWDVAIEMDSPTIKRFQRLARELDMCLVFGFAERIKDEIFNSSVFIDNLGQISGKYHKMQLAEGYDPTWWFNRLGKQSRAFDTPYGRCGILICNDRWNPLLAKIPALDGAQFLVIPSFGSTSQRQDEAVLARGTENHLPVIEANVGVTLVVNNDKIAAADRRRDGITFADIDIPPTRPRDVSRRDQVEAEFFAWRDKEMPIRLAKTTKANNPRGVASERDYAVLKSSQLEVVIGNNKALEYDGTQHRAGYNGVFSLKSTLQPDSPFVPDYAGLNLEHYFDGSGRRRREDFFEPRYSSMKLRRIDDNTVELYQAATRVFQVESWTRFSVALDYIDFSFRCKPYRDDYQGNFLGTFWASYINGPLDKSMYLLDANSSLEQPGWIQFCTQTHNRDSTVTHANDKADLKFDSGDTLFANISPLRYSAPFFYGRFRNMVLIYVFHPQSTIRFSHSPSGGGRSAKNDGTNPAWDFQLIIPQPKAGNEYELRGRLLYKQWEGRDDVLARVAAFLEASPPEK